MELQVRELITIKQSDCSHYLDSSCTLFPWLADEQQSGLHVCESSRRDKQSMVCSPGREPSLTKNKEFKTCLKDKLYQ